MILHCSRIHSIPRNQISDAAASAERLARTMTADLGLPGDQLQPAFEDPLARLLAEVSEPAGSAPDA